ncbi:uncharacterized protein LY79DRAFT_168281 [Colletotrichum navitas]|uniref:Uncharacterized protein n=1 Tax=Colletotrichum navitas TaxID=681940 RepID=A0AAD8Q1D4_9PEZI|nr:uncharacterized protein LY79DRAFT_168281 [Colletotrichum navitas]KAK1594052.1 hypothetical protein LY79DRAFT_168281 [Colletotrichum navitas]
MGHPKTTSIFEANSKPENRLLLLRQACPSQLYIPWADYHSLCFYSIVSNIIPPSSRASFNVSRLPRPWETHISLPLLLKRTMLGDPGLSTDPRTVVQRMTGLSKHSVQTPSDLAVLVYLPDILVGLIPTGHRCLSLRASWQRLLDVCIIPILAIENVSYCLELHLARLVGSVRTQQKLKSQ